MTSRRVWGMLLAVSLVAMAACTGGDKGSGTTGSGGHVTLDFWVYQEGGVGSFLQTLITKFEAAHPSISVDLTQYPEQNYGIKLDTALAAGKTPDLILVYDIDYMRRGLLLPLDGVVAENGLDLSTWNQAIVRGPS